MRPLTPADAGQMAQLEAEMYPPSLRAGRSQLRKDLDEAEWEDSNLSYGLFSGDELAGVFVAFYEQDSRRLFDYLRIPRPADVVPEECVFVADFSVRRAYCRHTLHLLRECWVNSSGYHGLPLLGFSLGPALDRWLKRRVAFRRFGYEYVGNRRLENREAPHELFLVRFEPSYTPTYVLERETGLRVDVIRNQADWRGLAPEWDEVLYATPQWTTFQCFQMQQIWWRHLAGNSRLFIVVVRDGGGIRAIAPLRIAVTTYLGRPRRLVKFIGEPSEMDRPTILRRGEDREAVTAVFRYLVERRDAWDSLMFYEQSVGGIVMTAALEHFGIPRELVGILPGPMCPWVDLNGSWHQFSASKSRGFKKSLRRKMSGLKRRGEVEFRTIEACSESTVAFGLYLDVESRSWKRNNRVGVSKNQAYVDYHRALVTELGPGRKPVFRILLIDGKPIAATFGILDRGRFFSLHIAHDQEYDSLSPGVLLTAYELEEAYARDDHQEYEFLGGFLDNKLTWASNTRETRHFYVYRRELPLRIYYVWHFRIKLGLKRILRRIGLFSVFVSIRDALWRFAGAQSGRRDE